MDTNVFISKLKSDDPYNSEAETIIVNLEKGDEIQAETSVLTLLETAAVAGRLYHARMGQEDEDGRQIFVAKTIKMLAGLKIRFIHLPGDAPLPLGNAQITMPSIFNESILLSIQANAPLRTLDLIHVAAARHAKQTNHKLGAFVTGDSDLLSKKNHLSKIIGMPILTPREYVDGLGL